MVINCTDEMDKLEKIDQLLLTTNDNHRQTDDYLALG